MAYQRTFDGVPIESHTIALAGETELQEQDFDRCGTDRVGLAVISYKMAPARTGPDRKGVIQRRNSARVIDFRAVDGELAQQLMEDLGFYLQDSLPLAEVPVPTQPPAPAPAEDEEEEDEEAGGGPEDSFESPERPDLDPDNLPDRDPERTPRQVEEDGWAYAEPSGGRANGSAEAASVPRGNVVGQIRPRDPRLVKFLERG